MGPEDEKIIEKAKKILFNDALTVDDKILFTQALFISVPEFEDRMFVEGTPSCENCAHSDDDGDCLLHECCYLEGSNLWELRNQYKNREDEEYDD